MARTPRGVGSDGKKNSLRDGKNVSRNKRKAREEARKEIGSPGVFARASKSAIKKRRTVRAAKGKKARDVMTYEHARHMKALNESFGAWVRDAATDGLWLDAAQEYVAFATQIEERYLARAGEVMTFGTGDCGQLGHGVEEYSDTEVKYPRVVSMSKLLPTVGRVRITRVSCGGLHTTCIASDGRIINWGCNDDFALGRVTGPEDSGLGNENLPAFLDAEAVRGVVFVGVSSGDCHTAAVSAGGEVYVWGVYKDKEGKRWFHTERAEDCYKVAKHRRGPIKMPAGAGDMRDAIEVGFLCACPFSQRSRVRSP